jgi:hypothetical protein
MTVSEVIKVASRGGTFSESSIAPFGPGRGGFRRRVAGGQCRSDFVGHDGRRFGPRGADRRHVRLVGRVGGFAPGRKILTLAHSIIAGGSHIDHADVLRSGATGEVLGHRVMAPPAGGPSCARSASAMSVNSKR